MCLNRSSNLSGVLVFYVLVWLCLMVFLGVGAVALQRYTYSEPTDGMIWRAPLAGTVVTLVLAFWGFLHLKSIEPGARQPGRFPDWFKFAPRDERFYTQLWGEQAGKKTLYRREKSATGQPEYR